MTTRSRLEINRIYLNGLCDYLGVFHRKTRNVAAKRQGQNRALATELQRVPSAQRFFQLTSPVFAQISNKWPIFLDFFACEAGCCSEAASVVTHHSGSLAIRLHIKPLNIRCENVFVFQLNQRFDMIHRPMRFNLGKISPLF